MDKWKEKPSHGVSVVLSLKKLSVWPNSKNTTILLLISFIIIILILPIMNYLFELSNYPVSFIESQLSFSGKIIKSHFAVMTNEEIFIYGLAQFADYIFLFSNGLFKFSLALILARKFHHDSSMRKNGFWIAVFGVLGSICDGIENGFIVLMVIDPQGFPNIFAVLHSGFAVIKFVLTGLFFAWILFSLIFLAYNYIRGSDIENESFEN